MPEKDVGTDLMGLLERATADDLAAIDAACEALRKKLNALEAVARIIRITVNGKPERKRPTPRGKAATPAGNGADDPRNAMQQDRRRQIARLLGSRGPLKAFQIANECEIPLGSMTKTLACDWFKSTDAGFRLTEVGRREAGL